MTRFLRYLLLFVAVSFAVDTALAQATAQIRGLHKVKRKETIFGIARTYDISIEELIDANPEMKNPNYELKKGDILCHATATCCYWGEQYHCSPSPCSFYKCFSRY